ncbi:MAG TPA: RNA-binding protein [Verrucomicrobiae bacterium]|jgi:RNA recognition motif-containing protein
MNTKLFVGNLSFDTTELDLQDLFATAGPVTEVNIVTDRTTGRPRGFAFVTMATAEGAQAAITQLGGKNVNGRDLTVNEARPREERSGGGGGGGRGYGGGGGGGGGRGYGGGGGGGGGGGRGRY